MMVRMISDYDLRGRHLILGNVYELEPDDAREVVRQGCAVFCSITPERAVKPPGETRGA